MSKFSHRDPEIQPEKTRSTSVSAGIWNELPEGKVGTCSATAFRTRSEPGTEG